MLFRSDTLDLLQRDSRALERALNTAGLRTDDNSLQFNLRDNGQGGQNARNFTGQQGRQDGSPMPRQTMAPRDTSGDTPRAPVARPSYGQGLARASGLDIRV